MRLRSLPLLPVLALLSALTAIPANAQSSWQGFHLGGVVGATKGQGGDGKETIQFDTNLDGTFGEAVRTAAGANAFEPGFCDGAAATTTPTGGCVEDGGGLEFGGQIGYDWQRGSLVLGAAGGLSLYNDNRDAVSAFSVTPASYTMSRSIKTLASIRGRAGIGGERILGYVTGGFVWGWIEEAFTTTNTVNTFVAANASGDDTTHGSGGFQGGGGVEFRLSDRLGVVGEYLFTSIDNRSDSIVRAQGPAPAGNPFLLTSAGGTDLRRSGTFDFHSFRLGLIYRF